MTTSRRGLFGMLAAAPVVAAGALAAKDSPKPALHAGGVSVTPIPSAAEIFEQRALLIQQGDAAALAEYDARLLDAYCGRA